MKKSNRKPAAPAVIPTEVKVGASMAALNARARQITTRLGIINAEAAKLSAEQHAIDLRRMQLRRDFDNASNP